MLVKKMGYLLIVCCLMFSTSLIGQSDTVPNTKNLLFLELQGLGGFGSLNYQRILLQKKPIEYGVRIGISTNNLYDFNLKFNPDIIFPISFIATYGNRHKLLLGLGQTVTSIVKVDRADYSPKRNYQFHTSASLGYNFNPNHRMVCGLMLYPLLIENEFFDLQYGLFIGYNF